MAENRGQGRQGHQGGQQHGHQGGQANQGPQGGGSQGQQGGAAGVLEAVRDRAGDLASNLGESAQQAWDSTRRGVTQAAGQLGDTAGDAWGSLTGAMRRYPLATLAVGFGLGVLVTLMMDRNRRF